MVFAANGISVNVNEPIPDVRKNEISTLSGVFGVLTNLVLGVGMALTVVFLIWGGISYMMAQGDAKAAAAARERLTNAVIGFIIVLAAFVIKALIINVIGGNTTFKVNDITP